MPELTEQTLARLSGLDPQTLRVAGVPDAQTRRIEAHLREFFRGQRPRLMTHRMVWSEMLERQRNLASSAQRNVFDPCQFVTDEALEKAKSQVRAARDRFRAACRKANQAVAALVSDREMRLIENAGNNPGLPAPYRWLELTDAQKKNIRRVIRVHRARQELAEKYPQLKQKISEADRARAIRQLLPEPQQERLASLRQRFEKTLDADPTEAP